MVNGSTTTVPPCSATLRAAVSSEATLITGTTRGAPSQEASRPASTPRPSPAGTTR
jgi:hypothetical protein